MSAERTERVTVACTDTGAPWSLWLVNFVTSALVLGCAIIYGGKKSAIHYTTVAALGMLVSSILFLDCGTPAPVHRRDFDVPGAAARGHPGPVAPGVSHLQGGGSAQKRGSMCDVGAQGPVLVEDWDDLAVGLEGGCYLGRYLRTDNTGQNSHRTYECRPIGYRLQSIANLDCPNVLGPQRFHLNARRSNHMHLLAFAMASIYLS